MNEILKLKIFPDIHCATWWGHKNDQQKPESSILSGLDLKIKPKIVERFPSFFEYVEYVEPTM